MSILLNKYLSYLHYKAKKLSHFSRVRFCVTPQTAAHQAPLSLGFSRQEYWSGLPFPSPVHESEKWKWSRSVVSDSSRPHGLQPTRLLRPWGFPGKSTGVGCHCLLHLYYIKPKLFMTQLHGTDAKAIMHFTYLERSDSIIVNSCHLILCQSVSSLVVNLKTSIELKHVQELKGDT